MGFDYVLDTCFTADLTILEEGSELIERLTGQNVKGDPRFPMFTSCCPGWIRFLKGQYPELVGNLSSAKSPQQMFGAVAKTYYAQKLGRPADKMCGVSIMPCPAKK